MKIHALTFCCSGRRGISTWGTRTNRGLQRANHGPVRPHRSFHEASSDLISLLWIVRGMAPVPSLFVLRVQLSEQFPR